MAKKYVDWEDPEIMDWEDDEMRNNDDRCLPGLALVTALGVYAFCRPRYYYGYGCRPRYYYNYGYGYGCFPRPCRPL